MNQALIFAGIVVAAAILGILLGHFLTLRSIGHVQPSAAKIEEIRSSQSAEPDPWADTAEMGLEDLGITEEEALEEAFAKTGLPRDQFDPKEFFHRGKEKMRPVGASVTGGKSDAD